MKSLEINWPHEFHPDNCSVHVSNELEMQASSEAVWNALTHALDWPDWYPNSANVKLLNSSGNTLEMGTQFRWKTFGFTIDCTVEEFHPFERIAWSSHSLGMSVYHAWLITPLANGCHVLTEETQNGLLPKLGDLLMPNRMYKFHQIWLEEMNKIAQKQD